MIARLAHQIWTSRNPVADMPPDVLERVRLQKPEARPPPVRSPWWTQVCFACFWDCSTERAIGFGGVGPIPSSAIRSWAAWKRIPAEHVVTLHDIVRRMDVKYLELEAARAKEK